MRPARVVERGPFLFLLGAGGDRTVGPFLLDPDPRSAASRFESLTAADVPARLRSALGALPETEQVRAFPDALARTLSTVLSRSVDSLSGEELRRALGEVPATDPAVERQFFLALGHVRLERALRAPEEVLITLAREEERVERALGREARAAESFVRVPDSPLDLHLGAWDRARGAFADLAQTLRESVDRQARQLVPNLTAVLGARTAARLVAAAGGVNALARMPAPRLQLLGSRRRPSPERGPRYGLLYRADRVAELPLGRRGAFARSLAALAAIAVRADAITHRDISAVLIARRDRRVDDLRRRRR